MAHHIKFKLLPNKPFLLLKEPKGDPVKVATFALLKNFSLKHVNRVDFNFDPFHNNVRTIRELNFHLNAKKIRLTNEKCSVRTTLTTNREDPEIKLKLENGKEIVYKTSNLTPLEILEHWINYTSQFTPPEEKVLGRIRVHPKHYGYLFKKQKPDWAETYTNPYGLEDTFPVKKK